MPSFAQAKPLDGSYAFASSEVMQVKDVAYRRQRYSKVVPKSQDVTRPHRSRRLYQYFGADPDRYFGVGPGSYECFGYDCNW